MPTQYQSGLISGYQ